MGVTLSVDGLVTLTLFCGFFAGMLVGLLVKAIADSGK